MKLLSLIAGVFAVCSCLPYIGGISDCVPTPVAESNVSSPLLPLGAELLPGDYAVTATSTEGRRVRGTMRLWRSSPVDSGWAGYAQDWVHVAEGDTVRHPLIGVTEVQFMGTTLDRDSTLDQRQANTNPVYPQVLVRRWIAPDSAGVAFTVLVDTSAERDPVIEYTDGAGNALHVAAAEAGSFRGYYSQWGIAGTEHDSGYFCAQLLPNS